MSGSAGRRSNASVKKPWRARTRRHGNVACGDCADRATTRASGDADRSGSEQSAVVEHHMSKAVRRFLTSAVFLLVFPFIASAQAEVKTHDIHTCRPVQNRTAKHLR